jgi:anti-sigma factor RsiW
VATERDIELLDTYLDGQIDGDEHDALRRRLVSEPELAAALAQLRHERSLRLSAFASYEPDDSHAQRITAGLQRALRRGAHHWAHWRRLGYGAAAAAAIILAFLAGAGWMGSTNPAGQVGATPPVYKVELRDEAGRVLAEQQFQSLDKAREFSEDLNQWRYRQERLLNGNVTRRSDQF